MNASARRARLAAARLYLCTPLREEAFLDAVLDAGVDVLQLRDKEASDEAILAAADVFRSVCDRHRALFIVNDRPDLARAAAADGVHVGQDDMGPEKTRAIVGDDMVVGRSTHSTEEIARALTEPVDYLGVGPVNETPTKPERPGTGLALVEHAARHVAIPWFVTGGMDVSTIPGAREAGASRFVVVRAITDARDPPGAVRSIRSAIDGG